MTPSIFVQSPPRLGNQYRDDAFLKSWLRRKLPAGVLRDIEGELAEMGELAGNELYELQLQDRRNAWEMRADGSYVQRQPRSPAEETGSQEALIQAAEQRHFEATRLRRRRPRTIARRAL